nr:site-specific DNA-methyltransferase [Mycoplasma sp. Pen4]
MDPPYNTEATKEDGNSQDYENTGKFVYKDKFTQNGWLNMMNDRLILARDLLKEDGVIFVSIDDTEQAYLKVLMDGIFGEDNFISSMPWVSNLKGRQANTNFALTHEYIICYKKSDAFEFDLLNNNEITKLMPNIYKERTAEIKKDQFGEYITQNNLENSNSIFNKETRPNLYFPIYINPEDFSISTKYQKDWHELFPPIIKKVQGVWRWSKEKVEKEKYNLEVFYNNQKYILKTKKRTLDWIIKSTILGQTLNNKNGNDLLESLIQEENDKKFKTAKPIDLITFLINLHQNKNARILDFFAGSGTTGHAIEKLNREDNGNRTYTLVTNNENQIADNITYERLFRISHGFGTKKETIKWTDKNEPYNSNLDVFKIKYDDISPLTSNQEELLSNVLNDVKRMLEDFGLTDIPTNEEILYKLNPLKVVK